MGHKKFKWGIFIGLLGFGLLIFWLRPWDNNKYGIDDLIPQDYAEIDRIHISGLFDTVEFHLTDSVWVFRDEKMNRKAVENLLIAAENLKMKSIVPIESTEKFEFVGAFIFYKGKKKEGEFQLLKLDKEYFLFQRESTVAYGVELAGYATYSLGKFFTSNPDHYREHLLISLLPSEIRTIYIEPLQGHAFRVYNNPVVVKDIPNNRDITAEIDTIKVKMLFSYFTAISYKQRVLPGQLSDGAIAMHPDCIIEVTDKNEKQYLLEVFRWTKEGKSEPDIFESITRYNGQEHYYSVNYYYLELLMRGIDAYR